MLGSPVFRTKFHPGVVLVDSLGQNCFDFLRPAPDRWRYVTLPRLRILALTSLEFRESAGDHPGSRESSALQS